MMTTRTAIVLITAVASLIVGIAAGSEINRPPRVTTPDQIIRKIIRTCTNNGKLNKATELRCVEVGLAYAHGKEPPPLPPQVQSSIADIINACNPGRQLEATELECIKHLVPTSITTP